jgi:serine phosphatase RsbU (regulator of sigma subunit)
MNHQEKIVEELSKKLKDKETELNSLYTVLGRLNSYVGRLIEDTEVGIRAAMSLNRKLATKKLPNVPDIRFSSRYLIATTDHSSYFDFFELPETGAGIVLCDSNGYGLSAVLMSIIMSLLETPYIKSPRQFTETVATDIKQHVASGKNPYNFKGKTAAILYMTIDRRDMSLNYCSIGMPGFMVIRGTSRIHLDGSASANLLNLTDIQEKKFKLMPGDRIIIPNNGITTAQNQDSKKFGLDGLEMALDNAEHLPIADVINNIAYELDTFIDGKRSRLSGDTAVLAIELERKMFYVV